MTVLPKSRIVKAEHHRGRRTTSATVMELCQERRGVFKDMEVSRRVSRVGHALLRMPLNEIIYDFFDALKSPHDAATPRWTMSF